MVNSVIEATNYANIYRNTKVFNTNEINHVIYVHLPDYLCNDTQLYEVKQLIPKVENDISNIIEHSGFVKREGQRPWIDISTEMISIEQGHHIYKLSFINVLTNDIYHLYISYIIQQDNPDRKYVYMGR